MSVEPSPQGPYTSEAWERLLARSIASIQSLSKLKGGEYAGDADRLANFRRNAKALGLLPEQVWAVYAGKHWDAFMQYVNDLASGKQRPRSESISGRLDDLIVYALLAKAMVEEREEAEPKRIAYTPAPRQALGTLPSIPPNSAALQLLTEAGLSRHIPQPLDPQCPKTGATHRWGRQDRYTDTCIACGNMRPHQRGG